MQDWLTWLSLVLAILSLLYNAWQYHSYSKKIDGLRRSMSAWWHTLVGMKESVELFWKDIGKDSDPEKCTALAKGTFNGLHSQSNRLAEDIAKTTVTLGFSAPFEEPWNKNKKE